MACPFRLPMRGKDRRYGPLSGMPVQKRAQETKGSGMRSQKKPGIRMPYPSPLMHIRLQILCFVSLAE